MIKHRVDFVSAKEELVMALIEKREEQGWELMGPAAAVHYWVLLTWTKVEM